MALFERQQTLGGVTTGSPEARSAGTLADTLSSFGKTAFGAAKEAHVSLATQEALTADVSEGIDKRSEFSEAGRKYNKIVQAGYLAQVKNDYTKRIGELALEHGDDPEAFKIVSDSYRSETLNSIDPEFRQAVAADFDQSLIKPHLKIKSEFEKRTLNESFAAMETAANGFMEAGSKAAREGDIEGLQHNETAIEGLAIQLEEAGNPQAAGKLRDQYKTAVQKQVVLGQADEQIQAGNGDTYIKEFIENPPEFLTPEQADSYSATMIAMNNRYQSVSDIEEAGLTIEQERSISNLKIQAHNGLGSPEDILATTEQYFDQGWIGESERTSIINDLMKGDKQKADTQKLYADIHKRLNGDDAIVLDSGAVNDYYENEWLPTAMDGQPTEVQEANAAFFVNRVKQVPTALKNQLQTFAISNDIELMKRASTMIDRIDDTPGLVDSVMKPHQQAMIELSVQLSENLDPAEAIQLAREATNPNDVARIEARSATIKDEEWRGNYRDDVNSLWSGWFTGPDIDDLAADRMSREYGNLFESYYKAGLEEDAARNRAEKVLKRNYSEWNGRVMKYSPDSFYQVAGSTDYVLDQLYNDVKKSYYTDKPLKKKNLVLFADEDTARTAATGSPRYKVAIMDESGIEVVTGFKWYPDMDKQKSKIKAQNKSLTESVPSPDPGFEATPEQEKKMLENGKAFLESINGISHDEMKELDAEIKKSGVKVKPLDKLTAVDFDKMSARDKTSILSSIGFEAVADS